jgi:LDH2 family malate/lactate/ureidoglycolate dehydrogenase
MKLFENDDDRIAFVPVELLQEKVIKVFLSFGFNQRDAALATDVMIQADLRGVTSHGVARMLKVYADEYHAQKLNAKPNIKIIKEAPASANLDGDAGLGIVIVPKAMKIAIEKANACGIGMVTINNSRHLGMASYHSMLALEKGMIGMCMSGCPPRVLPTFGAEEKLGTNPIAIAAPNKQEPHFVFDAATSAVSYNTFQLAHQLGIPLPPGIVAEANTGRPYQQREVPCAKDSLLPLGSFPENSSHKGYGLACMVEVLTGILSGIGHGAKLGRPHYNHMVIAIDIKKFVDYDIFLQRMNDFLNDLSNTKPAAGYERVLFPGVLEWESKQKCLKQGIPVPNVMLEWLNQYLKSNKGKQNAVMCNIC